MFKKERKKHSKEDVGAGSGTGSLHGRLLVGRKILKRLGDDTVMSGHVREYNPPTEGKEGSWTLRYENPHAEEGDDENNSYDHEHVNRAELDKLLNLQKVREREFPQVLNLDVFEGCGLGMVVGACWCWCWCWCGGMFWSRVAPW